MEKHYKFTENKKETLNGEEVYQIIYTKDNEKQDIKKDCLGGYLSKSSLLGENTYLHPDAIVESNSVIGNDCYIACYAHISSNCKIGNNCEIQSIYMHKNTTIGNNVDLCKQVTIFGSTNIGNDVIIDNNTIIGDNSVIEDSTEIGKNCKIQPNVHIEKNVVIEDNVIIGKQCIIKNKAYIHNNSEILIENTTIGKFESVKSCKFELPELEITIITSYNGVVYISYGYYKQLPLSEFISNLNSKELNKETITRYKLIETLSQLSFD